MRKSRALRIALIIGIPVVFAFAMRVLFGMNGLKSALDIMSVAFIFLLPSGIGALTIYLSSYERVQRLWYRFFMPWLPIFCFSIVTLFFGVEGWACWLMILPVFLISSSIGGLIAGYFKLRKKRNEKLFVSLIALLPVMVSPAEQAISKIPGQYKAYTFIDINAPKNKIWKNVTRVSEIPEKEDKAWFTRTLGFPRPIKAELNYEGVGAYRKAIFDKGLVFDETVIAYEDQHKMTFSIKANPYDIPSTTMDEHIVVGGEYFDVLNGTYELEKMNETTYRLHLYSYFKLTTTFNFYASWWAGWIMKDIQNNILKVIKQRSETT